MYTLTTNLPELPKDYPISASIVADSISQNNVRLTTFELEFPRYILAELGTHRVFSRNTSSSRAIPTAKLIQSAMDKFVEPVRYGINKSGMQPSVDTLQANDLLEAKKIWREMAEFVTAGCARLAELKLHKQWASRPLEWFSTVRLTLSTTKLDNFFKLRDHDEAQEEICYLAQAMKVAANNSIPKFLKIGQWHLPYVTAEDLEKLGLENAIKVSTSRCARNSYKTHHGVTSTLEEDLELFKKLVHGEYINEDDVFHASPTEHPATPCLDSDYMPSNFHGWNQYRKFLENNRNI